MFPIKAGMIYSICTVLLFEFGVWNYPEINRTEFNIFMIFAHIAMIMGFFLGTRLDTSYAPQIKNADAQQIISKVFNFLFVITVLTFIPAFIIKSGMYDFSFGRFFDSIKNGLENAQAAYTQIHNNPGASGFWVYINYLLILTGWARWAFTPLAIILWKRLSKLKRAFTLLYWLSIVTNYLAAGINFGIIDLGIQLVSALLLKKILAEKENDLKEVPYTLNLRTSGFTAYPIRPKPKKRTIRYLLIGILIFAFILVSFSNTMNSRIGESYDNAKIIAGNYVTIDEENLLWKITPNNLKPLLANLTSYVTHGYNALALGINLPFTSTYGFGASWFLLDNMLEMFNIDLYPNTYYSKIYNTYGWNYKLSYSTAYIAVANDVSFVLLPFLLLIMMAVFGFAWKDFLTNHNPFAYLMMIMFFILIVYLPAQCYLFALPDTLFAFWIVLLVWLFNRKKLDWSSAL